MGRCEAVGRREAGGGGPLFAHESGNREIVASPFIGTTDLQSLEPHGGRRRDRRDPFGRDAFHGVHRCVSHAKSRWTAWNPSLPDRRRFTANRHPLSQAHGELEPRMALMGADERAFIIRDYPRDPRLIHLRFMGSRLSVRNGVPCALESGRARARLGGRGGFPSLPSALSSLRNRRFLGRGPEPGVARETLALPDAPQPEL
jgi:hypothetical protein